MQQKIKKKCRAFVQETLCVACGCCVKVCPMAAIEIYKGIRAEINAQKCVGCGRCLSKCPIRMNIVRVMKKLGGRTDG